MPLDIEPGSSVRSGIYVTDKSKDNYSVINSAGSAVGAATGQWWIPFALKGVEMLYDNFNTKRNNRLADKRQAEQNSFNSFEAAASRAAQSALLDKEARLNSVQSQVHQLKAAGLNPALATGPISAGTASASGTAQASSSTPLSPEQFKSANMGAVAQAAMMNAQIDNLNSSSQLNRANTVSAEIEQKSLDQRFQGEIAKQLAEVTKLLASANLDDAQKNQLSETLDLLKKQYQSQIDLNVASTNKTESEVPLAQQNIAESESRIAVNNSTIATNKTQQALNKSATKLNEFKSLTEQEQAEVLRTVQALNKQNTKELARKYHLSIGQEALIKKYLSENGLDPRWTNALYEALNNFSQSSGQSVPKMATDILKSWLDGGNWLHYLGMRHFAGGNGSYVPPESSNDTTPPLSKSSDVVKTVPDDKYLLQHAIDVAKKGKFEPEFVDNYDKGMKYMKNTLTPREYSYVKQDLYYTDDPVEFKEIFYYYYNMTKNSQTITNERRFHNRD